MPELPEVETVCKWLAETVVNHCISDTDVHWERTVAFGAASKLKGFLQNKKIASVSRRAKYIVINFEDYTALVIHLRMSGELRLENHGAPLKNHDRLVIKLDRTGELRFNDPRKFGRVYIVEDTHAFFSHLGPEPFSNDLSPEWWINSLKKKRGAIKPLLLRQDFIAGIGNIYAAEILWRSKIHPLKAAHRVSKEGSRRLHFAVKTVLDAAVRSAGTDLGDGVWKEGGYRPKVYGRTGEPCERCKTKIKRIIVGQRSTDFCPKCQAK